MDRSLAPQDRCFCFSQSFGKIQRVVYQPWPSALWSVAFYTTLPLGILSRWKTYLTSALSRYPLIHSSPSRSTSGSAGDEKHTPPAIPVHDLSDDVYG